MTNKEFPQQANMPYPYPMPYQDNDEIDLIELFRTLWKQKAKIALNIWIMKFTETYSVYINQFKF